MPGIPRKRRPRAKQLPPRIPTLADSCRPIGGSRPEIPQGNQQTIHRVPLSKRRVREDSPRTARGFPRQQDREKPPFQHENGGCLRGVCSPCGIRRNPLYAEGRAGGSRSRLLAGLSSPLRDSGNPAESGNPLTAGRIQYSTPVLNGRRGGFYAKSHKLSGRGCGL